MEQQRVQESRTETLAKEVTRDKILAGNFESDEKVEQMRRQRELQEIEREKAQLRSLQEKALKEKEKAFYEQQEKIAAELDKRRTTQLRDEKIVQRIREESPEIRELEAKLKAAYMNKERETQLHEKTMMATEAKMRETADLAEAEKARQRELERDRMVAEKKREQQKMAKKVLEEQMEQQEVMKKKAWESFLREKAMVDEVVAKIMEEEKQDQLNRMRKQQETRDYIDHYLNQREKLKEAERKKIEDENRKIVEYAEMKRKRDDELRAVKAAQDEEKNRIFEALSEQAEEERRRQEEMEQIRIELHLQEDEEKRMAKEKENMEKKLRARLEMMRANEYQKQLKQARLVSTHQRTCRAIQRTSNFCVACHPC